MKKVFIATLLLGLMAMTSQVYAVSNAPDGLGWHTHSWWAIERFTGREVTGKYLGEYKEHEPYVKDGILMVETSGFVELGNDGYKRRFWCHFRKNTGDLLRLKIDGDVLYSVLGW